MFGIGTFEMLVVAMLALLLFSPRELPKIIKGVSQLWGSLRRTADEFRDAILQEEAMQDLKEAVDGTKAQLRDAESTARRELMKARMEARRAENKLVRVARERERQEREAQKAELGEGEGEGGADGKPPGEGPAPSGTVAAGSSSAAAPAAKAAGPATVADARPASTSSGPTPSRPVAESEPPPKTVDPRHAGKPDGSGGGSSASQGAA